MDLYSDSILEATALGPRRLAGFEGREIESIDLVGALGGCPASPESPMGSGHERRRAGWLVRGGT